MRALVQKLRQRWLARRTERDPTVREADALIQGKYLDYLIIHHHPVPEWAVLNAAAHGDLQRLHDIGQRAPALFVPAMDPVAASGMIGNALRRYVSSDSRLLRETQNQLLIPFELQLMNFDSRIVLPLAELVTFTDALIRGATR